MGNFYTISVKVYIPFHILFTLFPCFFSLSSVTTQAFNLLYYSCLFRRRTCINFNFHAVFLLSVPRFRNVGKNLLLGALPDPFTGFRLNLPRLFRGILYYITYPVQYLFKLCPLSMFIYYHYFFHLSILFFIFFYFVFLLKNPGLL